MVDTVLYFEGDNNFQFRILRGIKNRFGPTNEIGVFEMLADGLKRYLIPLLYFYLTDKRMFQEMQFLLGLREQDQY